MTGAGGFIGAHVAGDLARSGWRVAAAGHAGRPCPSAAAARWGALTPESLEHLNQAIGGADAIIHCAGGSSVAASLRDPTADFERTVTSTQRVLEFMRTHAPAARLVLMSSAAVYGAAGTELLHEGLPKRPVSPYGEHKARAEDLVAEWSAQYGLDATALRLFSVYGPGLRKQVLWELSRRALTGENPLTLFGSGEERRDFIAIGDAARLIARAADPSLRPPPTLNGGSGRATSVRDLAERLLGALGISAELAFSGAAKAGDPDSMVADMTRATAFGFAPTAMLEDELARYAAWVRNQT